MAYNYLCTIIAPIINKHIKRVSLYDNNISLYIPEFKRGYVPKKVRTDDIHIVWFKLVRDSTGSYHFNVDDRRRYLIKLLKRIEKSVD